MKASAPSFRAQDSRQVRGTWGRVGLRDKGAGQDLRVGRFRLGDGMGGSSRCTQLTLFSSRSFYFWGILKQTKQALSR